MNRSLSIEMVCAHATISSSGGEAGYDYDFMNLNGSGQEPIVTLNIQSREPVFENGEKYILRITPKQ